MPTPKPPANSLDALTRAQLEQRQGKQSSTGNPALHAARGASSFESGPARRAPGAPAAAPAGFSGASSFGAGRGPALNLAPAAPAAPAAARGATMPPGFRKAGTFAAPPTEPVPPGHRWQWMPGAAATRYNGVTVAGPTAGYWIVARGA